MANPIGAEVIESLAVKEYARDAQVFHYPANTGQVGATAGVTMNNDTGTVKFPASGTADTFTIPITGLKQGDIITAFKVSGQLESAGNAITLDADLRATTAAAAALTDASLGAITQISKTADYLIADSKTLAAAHTVISGNSYYVLLTCTSLANTDIDLQGVEVTVNQR